MEKRIVLLIVSPDQEFITRVSLLSSQSGYALLAAATGDEGPGALSRQAVDVMIVDDEAGGAYDFCKAVKADRGSAIVPIIVVSGLSRLRDAFRSLGVEHIFSKPVNEYVLFSYLSSCLNYRADAGPEGKGGAAAFPNLFRKRILLGGPDPDCLATMAALLRRQGVEVAGASKGPDLVARAGTFYPDLVIMDAFMGRMDSAAEFIRAVRQLSHCQSIPVLIYSYYRVSALGSEDFETQIMAVDSARDACLEAGATMSLGPFAEAVFLPQVSAAAGTPDREEDA